MLLLVVVCTLSCKDKSPVRSGDEVFAIMDETVVEVSLTGAHDRVVVRRDAGSKRFKYRFVRDGRASACGPTAALDAATRRLFSVHALEVFSEQRVVELKALPKERWINLQVGEDGDPIEPFRLAILAPHDGSSGKRVEALMREFDVGFTVDPALLDLWRSSCSP